MHEEIAANKRRSVLLFAGAFLFFGVVGVAIGYVFGTGLTGLAIALRGGRRPVDRLLSLR